MGANGRFVAEKYGHYPSYCFYSNTPVSPLFAGAPHGRPPGVGPNIMSNHAGVTASQKRPGNTQKSFLKPSIFLISGFGENK